MLFNRLTNSATYKYVATENINEDLKKNKVAKQNYQLKIQNGIRKVLL